MAIKPTSRQPDYPICEQYVKIKGLKFKKVSCGPLTEKNSTANGPGTTF